MSRTVPRAVVAAIDESLITEIRSRLPHEAAPEHDD
jgi:hypothetical protein